MNRLSTIIILPNLKASSFHTINCHNASDSHLSRAILGTDARALPTQLAPMAFYESLSITLQARSLYPIIHASCIFQPYDNRDLPFLLITFAEIFTNLVQTVLEGINSTLSH